MCFIKSEINKIKFRYIYSNILFISFFVIHNSIYFFYFQKLDIGGIINTSKLYFIYFKDNYLYIYIKINNYNLNKII